MAKSTKPTPEETAAAENDNVDNELDTSGGEKLTLATVNSRTETAFKATQDDVRQYWANRLFVEGEQWIKWLARDKAFVPWRRANGKSQATVNQLDNLMTTYMGKIIKDDLEFDVPASTADDYAIQGALVAESIIRHKHEAASWEDKRESLVIAALLGGTSALATEWEPSAQAYGALRTGDTCETVLNITEFAVEAGAKEARYARFWVKAQVLPPEEVQATFKLDWTPKADFNSGGPFSGGLRESTATSSLTKGVRVLTYYERPNFLRPEGAVAVVVNNRFVSGPKPWPFPFKNHLNLEVVKETVIDSQWNGVTRLTKARPVQVQYNFVWTNIQDHIKKVGTAKPLVPYGTSEVLDQWDNDPANALQYPEGATPPTYLVPPGLPSYIINSLEELKNEMEDVMGIHDISQGNAPANIESGFGLQTLAEQDASPATAMAKRVARAFANTASSDLEMLAKFVNDTRTATVYQPNGQGVAESARWTGKDIAGQTHVVIPADSIIPQSRAAMNQFAQTIAGMGMLPPGVDGLTMLLEIAQVPNREQSMWYVNPPEARSRHDVARIMEGETVVPREFHNHQVAIAVGNRARMSARYDTLTNKTRENLDEWVLAHQRFAEEQAGQQLSKAAMSPALANTPAANNPAPLPAELMGMNPNQPAQLPPQMGQTQPAPGTPDIQPPQGV